MKRKFITAHMHLYGSTKETAEMMYECLDKTTRIMIINYWYDLKHPNWRKGE